MSKIVNLRQARKNRGIADRKQRGDENAARFGRTKHQKALDTKRAEKAERDLDGKQRDS